MYDRKTCNIRVTWQEKRQSYGFPGESLLWAVGQERQGSEAQAECQEVYCNEKQAKGQGNGGIFPTTCSPILRVTMVAVTGHCVTVIPLVNSCKGHFSFPVEWLPKGYAMYLFLHNCMEGCSWATKAEGAASSCHTPEGLFMGWSSRCASGPPTQRYAGVMPTWLYYPLEGANLWVENLSLHFKES